MSCEPPESKQSLPVRGAWVEMREMSNGEITDNRRSPCGERGLKCLFRVLVTLRLDGRSPCGERGLKLTQNRKEVNIYGASLPVRGAWVEILLFSSIGIIPPPSLPVRGAWVEMRSYSGACALRTSRSPCGERGLKSYVRREAIELVESLPVRGAWVEIRKPPP